MATMTQRLRDRWDQISPREQRLLVVLAAASVVVVIGLLWRGISAGLSEIEQQNEDLRGVLTLLEEYREIRATAGAASERVELPAQPVKLQSYLEEIANGLGITIPGFSPLPGASREGVVTASTRIDVRDISIADLGSFLSQVETRSESVVVESLEIRTGRRDKEKLDVTMVVTAYATAKKDKPEDADEGDEEDG
ncbi:MAG: hypothetical protein Tsb0020_25630 [Haliangiales bacterium]